MGTGIGSAGPDGYGQIRMETKMKIGNVPESVLKRSVLKQIHTRREEVLLGAGVGEDCAILALPKEDVFVVSTDPVTGTSKDIGTLAVHVTLNDLASSGAEPVALLVSALLPPETQEPEIREMIQEMEAVCGPLHVQIAGGHTEVTTAVNRPVLTVTGIGRARRERVITTKGARAGQDVVLSKWIGLEGTAILAKEKEKELLTRYPSHLIREAKAFDRYLSIVPEAATAGKSGVTAMHDVTEGGIFGALWELAESSGVGLEIDLKRIPIRQETIEICEFFGINPYGLISSGSLLMVTDDGLGLVRELEREKIPAAVIGKIREGNDRVVINEEERRFLEPPKADELYQVLG